jgi:hypothetical protein
MLSLIPTAANCRDSQGQIVRTRRFRIPEAAMLRISAKTSNSPLGFARTSKAIARDASHGQDTAIYGARLRLSPRTSNSPLGFARTRHGNNREHGHFPTATLRWRSVSPFGNMADLTDKTKLV